jgi:hypothetical protein
VQGRRVGSGSFGEVFRGELDDPAGGEPIDVVLKKRKLSLNAQRVRTVGAAPAARSPALTQRPHGGSSSASRRQHGGVCAATPGWHRSWAWRAKTRTWCGATPG